MRSWRSLLCAAPAAVLLVITLAQGLQRGPVLDASVFAMVAELMRDGAMPYRDVFDHKPPGIYLVQAAVGEALPFIDAWTRAWLVSLVAALVTLGLLAVRLGPRWPLGTIAALLSIAPLLGARYFAQGGGETESLAVLPATAALLLLPLGQAGSVDARSRALRSGVLVGLAGAVSFQAAPAALGIAVAYWMLGRGRALAYYCFGGVAVATAILVWLAVGSALGPALDQLVAYNRAYVTGQNILQASPVLTAALAAMMLAPAIAAAWLRVRTVLARRARDPMAIASMVWLASWVAYIVVQGQFIGHYATIVAAPLAVLAAPALDRFRTFFATPRTRPMAIAVAGMAVALPLLTVPPTEHGTSRRPSIDEAAATAARLAAPSETVFVWGNEPFIYLASGRAPASRYVYLFPLTQPHYTRDDHVASVLERWRGAPPAVIVDASLVSDGPSTVPLLGTVRLPIVPPTDKLDPLRNFVRSHYRLETTVGNWPIYVRT